MDLGVCGRSVRDRAAATCYPDGAAALQSRRQSGTARVHRNRDDRAAWRQVIAHAVIGQVDSRLRHRRYCSVLDHQASGLIRG